ncbi:DUF7344 domain-containing protein [Halomicrobium urmianum]|uniref:DUF7344 domain-containing protein n=1 Tax=Halomicrobium urmianum TaxID=1586233 RepID=UPI001CDA5204|nr:hypothetical protein [Halomicrobium urmianum]
MTTDRNSDETVDLLQDERNRAILNILHETSEPLSVGSLAEALVDRNHSILSAAEYEETLEQISISLHHNRLPRLSAAGLVEYDPQENTATFSATDIEAEWHNIEMIEEALTTLQPGDDGTDDIGVITGRTSVLEAGQSIADSASEELFCMYTSDELFEEDCMRSLQEALDRRVEIYAGSRDEDVLEFYQERLPEATLWEPQLDWMNSESTEPRIEWLILADREQVALSIRNADNDGKGEQARAIVGNGSDNPFVVLVRELLGPRLDHLDFQSEDFRDHLPF